MDIKSLSEYPYISVIPSDGVIVSVTNYPVYSTFTISYEEAAELAQQLMDAVSERIQKVAE